MWIGRRASGQNHTQGKEREKRFHSPNLRSSAQNSNLVGDVQSYFHAPMRLTKQEQTSLSVLLIIFLLALIGWLVF
jgi:hypothetical protein